jgi:hypothetical protein
LEDHLHAHAKAAQGLALLRAKVDAVEFDRSPRGLDDAHEGLAGGGLAAPRFADEPQGLALEDVKTHPGDRLDFVMSHAKGHFEVADLEEWLGRVAHVLTVGFAGLGQGIPAREGVAGLVGRLQVQVAPGGTGRWRRSIAVRNCSRR